MFQRRHCISVATCPSRKKLSFHRTKRTTGQKGCHFDRRRRTCRRSGEIRCSTTTANPPPTLRSRSILGDHLNLHQRILRQSRNRHRRPCRRHHALRRKILRINLIHRRKVAHRLQKHGRLHHMEHVQPGLRQHSLHVLQHPRRLFRNSAGNQLPRSRIQRHLPRRKQHIPHPYCL